MKTSKTNAKAASSVSTSPEGTPRRSNGVSAKQQEDFAAIVSSIAKRYGVRVAARSKPVTNPYAMSAQQSEKIALQAGIITRTGNLTRRFK